MARRTTVIRLVLGAALVGLLAAAFLMARDKDVRADAFFPPERSGIVVVDMSASVSALTYRRIGRALRRISAANEPVGLIVFSDAAYELFPWHAWEGAGPLLRYFTPVSGRDRPAFDAKYPLNPWVGSFSGGTRISEGLRVARTVLERDRIKDATVLLVSDLEAPQSDRSASSTRSRRSRTTASTCASCPCSHSRRTARSSRSSSVKTRS